MKAPPQGVRAHPTRVNSSPSIFEQLEVMRDRRLIEVEPRGEIANADLMLAASECCEDRDTSWIGEGLEEASFVGQIAVVHRCFGAASLNRHTSMLALNRKMSI